MSGYGFIELIQLSYTELEFVFMWSSVRLIFYWSIFKFKLTDSFLNLLIWTVLQLFLLFLRVGIFLVLLPAKSSLYHGNFEYFVIILRVLCKSSVKGWCTRFLGWGQSPSSSHFFTGVIPTSVLFSECRCSDMRHIHTKRDQSWRWVTDHLRGPFKTFRLLPVKVQSTRPQPEASL